MESAFLAELNKRQEQQAAQAEQTAAAAFDGQALLRLLQNKYGRSYDLSLVKREYMGKLFVAMVSARSRGFLGWTAAAGQ
jgi:hypothetical protein